MKTERQEKSVGEQLRTAREAKGWTLEEAARRTKLKRDALALIELDAFEKLPSLSYARGFIRIYARELGLDGWSLLKKLNLGVSDESLELLDLHPDDLEAIPRRNQPPLATSQGVGLFIMLGILGVALIIGGLKLYEVWPDLFPEEKKVMAAEAEIVEKAQLLADVPRPASTTEEGVPQAKPLENPKPAEPILPPPSAVPVATPVAAPVVEAAPAPAPVTGSNSLQLIASASVPQVDRWVKVVGIRGGREIIFFEDILPAAQTAPGVEQPWVADSFVVTFREASAVEVIYNGTNYGPYPKAGPQRVNMPNQ
jgi:cytoskeleton protein RodZ